MVAHLQDGLLLGELEAPLADNEELAGIIRAVVTAQRCATSFGLKEGNRLEFLALAKHLFQLEEAHWTSLQVNNCMGSWNR